MQNRPGSFRPNTTFTKSLNAGIKSEKDKGKKLNKTTVVEQYDNLMTQSDINPKEARAHSDSTNKKSKLIRPSSGLKRSNSPSQVA